MKQLALTSVLFLSLDAKTTYYAEDFHNLCVGCIHHNYFYCSKT
jgi:hypothetical protein